MAGISSVSGLSSLAEDLYYQYMIDHNPTSTMLNAISGADDSSSDTSGIMDAVSDAFGTGLSSPLGTSSSVLAQLGSLSGLAGLDDGNGLLGASQALSGFSDILDVYLNAQRAESSQMADSLSSVLEEAAQTEDTSSLTYRTVQDIYQYFVEKSSAAGEESASVAQRLREGQASGAGQVPSTPQQMGEVDIDALAEQLQQRAEAAISVPVF